MRRPILLVLACLVSATALAEVHKCKDENGKTFFSDRGCAGGEKMRGAPGGDSHTIGTPDDDKRIALRCVDNYREAHAGVAAEATRLNNYQIKWVSVRSLGARRLVTVNVGLLNEVGFWAAATQHQCLLRGDNVTFQTTPYELVD